MKEGEKNWRCTRKKTEELEAELKYLGEKKKKVLQKAKELEAKTNEKLIRLEHLKILKMLTENQDALEEALVSEAAQAERDSILKTALLMISFLVILVMD